jgi:hypothetical protein
MPTDTKRTTVYLRPALHRALRLKAAETDRPMSALINDAVQISLAEDEADLTAFEDRADEKTVSFSSVLKKLKSDGKI